MQETATSPGAPRRRWLRAALLVLPAAAFVGLLTVAVAGKSAPPAPGDQAPAFEAALLNGKGTLALEELRGRPVVLNFWASWCIPCKDEAPMLREAEARYGDDVAFVGVDIRDARSDATAFVEEHGLDYPHVRDEDLGIYDAYGLTGQPETFFIDEEGKILEHVPGPLFRETLFQLLDSLTARAA
ncbi:MAG: TlpA family protein disulfide reductase [Actinomycetota bacterium]|nr:TlpA family protein disulfide reductase [Actinomycetota bacterium]